MSIEKRLSELGLELPEAPSILGLYKPVLVVDGLAYTSGHGPLKPEGGFVTGRLGDDLGVDEGSAAARMTGLAMLASLKAELGSLDRVGRLVKTLGLVQATPDFAAHPAVINGFSELMRDALGDEAGVAARSAFGAASLPAGWAVEIEAVFTVCD
ncbi:Endoribonuclease L-PSP [Pseudobythopirellula maris]|uniref:Endoribonuclease L-PSP n=1 Tax=Pseudobythopirellula maris TaxID=2527991 RepID=A0A5C5ZPN6_9BACT|nr:RidA family protein [Pseudobythopirellula maris]TWT88751.1 Endoribonuclease L-PSP [Pseudobythopirellula maris]